VLLGTILAAGIVTATLAVVAYETQLHGVALGTSLDRQRALAIAKGRLEALGAAETSPEPGTRVFATPLPGFVGEESVVPLEPGLFSVEVRVTEPLSGATIALSSRCVWEVP
jgi:hypothetical protein